MKALKMSKPPDDAIRDILRFSLEKKKVQAVFSLSKIEGNGYAYALISNKELLSNICPTFPLMPVNSAKMISRLTAVEAVKSPIAVVLRPCELRALFELVKLEQAKLDNLLFISFVCNGVFPIKAMKDGLDGKLEKYWENARIGQDFAELRESCRICESFVPDNADIVLMTGGSQNNDTSSVLMKTQKGEEFIEGINDQFVEEDGELKGLDNVRNRRAELKKTVFSDLKTEDFGIQGLARIFGRCINCHACSKACPICYCNLCHFEAAESESDPSTFEVDLNNRGALRLPTNTVFYHVGRLIHVTISCVGCGMCSDVCPTDIPVATVFTKIAEHVQNSFNYVPGRNVEEKIPILTFELEELQELGE